VPEDSTISSSAALVVAAVPAQVAAVSLAAIASQFAAVTAALP